jgi:hypothetical protein
MSKFTKNSPEVIGAKMICRSHFIYNDSIPPSEKVLIKNVMIEPGGKYLSYWKNKMYEIETNIGVFISAKDIKKYQNNLTSARTRGGASVDWCEYIGKEVRVVTGLSEAPGWLWIYFAW